MVCSSEHRSSIQIDKWGRRRRIRRYIFLEYEPVLADGDHVRVTKLLARDRPAIDGGAVCAHQVFEKEDGLNLHDSRVMPRDDGIFDHENVVGFPTNRYCLMGQFELPRAFP